jgi:integrase
MSTSSIQNPLLSIEQLNSTGIISEGRKGRESKRLHRKIKIQTETIYLIKQYLPGLTDIPANTSDYESKIFLLIDAIENKFTSPSELATAINFFAGIIDKGNKAGYWLLETPDRIIKVRRHRQMRSLKWFHTSTACVELSKQFESIIYNPEILEKADKNELQLFIILSACFYGGLNHESPLLALAKYLNNDVKLKHALLNDLSYVWIDLIYNDTNVSNIRMTDEKTDSIHECRIQRFFIDTWTLGLIVRFTKKEGNITAYRSSSSLFKSIKNILNKYHIKTTISSLNSLATASVAVSESLPNVFLSSALVETMNNRNISVSLPPEYWQYFFNTKEVNIPPINFSQYQSLQYIHKKSSKQKIKSAQNSSKLYSSLTKALSLKHPNAKKSLPSDALRKLSEIDTRQCSISELCLIHWYQYLLIDKKNTVSAVLRYHVEIGKCWLAYNKEKDLSLLDDASLYLAYKTMIDEKQSEKGKYYRAGRLQDIQQFAELNYDFAYLSTKLVTGTRSTPFVRSGYVTFSTYQNTLQSIEQLNGLDHNSIHSLQHLVILAYRTGLRLQELIKLRLCDIESSDWYWVLVKSNPFGDNKTDASLRKIPLPFFLNSNELTSWKDYFHHRKIIAKSDTELLFCQDNAGSTPWGLNFVSKLVADVLRELTGIETMVFHHLRHTAFSNIHLIAEKEWWLAEQFIGLTIPQIKKIYEVIFGKDEVLRVYWGIASFAGHNSPSTTLQSYLHFSDLIVFQKIAQNSVTLTYKEAQAISTLTGNKISRRLGKENTDSILIEKLRAYIVQKFNKKQIENFTIIKSNNIKTENLKTPNNTTNKIRITAKLVHKILKEYENKEEIWVLSNKYQVDQTYIEKWVNKAQIIANIKTRKGKKRLISKERLDSNKNAITPSVPISAIEDDDVTKIIGKLRNTYRENKAEITWAVIYYLNSTTTTNTGVLFNNEKNLNRFKAAFNDVIESKRWYQVNKNKSVYLHLSHPQEKIYIEKNCKVKKYSSSSLRYVMHLLGIMLP